MRPLPTLTDTVLGSLDQALRTLLAKPQASRPTPQTTVIDSQTLTDAERKESAALMRVNHVGEVCAQALYTAQSLSTRNPELRTKLEAAAREETDHLAWTEGRTRELGGNTSLLNPLWYAGAFGLGLIAGKMGDAWSLGFVVETERQVEEHLRSHLLHLPAADHASRAIVEQMREDEATHGQTAAQAGARELPAPICHAMRLAAKIMTTTAHRI